MTEFSIVSVTATSLLIAGLATILAAPPALLLAGLLAGSRFPGRRVVVALINVPLVIPPTAIGFLLLTALSQESALGAWLNEHGIQLLLSRSGAAIAVAIVIFPLIARTALTALEGVQSPLLDWMATLGLSRWHRFWQGVWPQVWPGMLAALTLGFTRGLGEFGATAVVAGMIPGQTLTLASGIFLSRELGQDDLGVVLTLLALALGVVAVLVSEWLSQRGRHDPR